MLQDCRASLCSSLFRPFVLPSGSRKIYIKKDVHIFAREMSFHKQKARVVWCAFAERSAFLSDGFPRRINIIYRRHLNIYSRKHIYLSREADSRCISGRGRVLYKTQFLRQRLSESTRLLPRSADIDILKRFHSW